MKAAAGFINFILANALFVIFAAWAGMLVAGVTWAFRVGWGVLM